jgi:CxxC motif-containing protein (DUF1111 family)
MAIRMLAVLAALAAPAVIATVAPPAPPPNQAERYAGGQTTVARSAARSLLEPAANLDLLRQESFLIGRALFRDPWVIAPASTSARDGLGPIFNASSCAACHRRGGRSDGPEAGAELPVGIVAHLALGGAGARTDPIYGDQLQTRGVDLGPHGTLAASDVGRHESLAVGEARIEVTYTSVTGRYPDGTPYRLRRPSYSVSELAYGDLDPATRLSVRLAPPLIGLGLLEAVPEAELRALADPNDADGDGISGRLAEVLDPATGRTVVGRFGHKAERPDLATQIASALRDDIGITSSRQPEQPCTIRQSACLATPDGAGPQPGVEIADDLLDALVYFSRLIAVPAAAPLDEQAQRGRRHFYRAGCSACHVPALRTGVVEGLPEISEQRIWPYTDLLLHDLGEELADPVSNSATDRREWRTPPLWGIGLTERFARRPAYLHDGRAGNLEEAILWHGGEAVAARERFQALSAVERGELIHFLRSL